MNTMLFNLLDVQLNGSSKFHGGTEYAKVFLNRLADEYSHSIQLVVFYNHRSFLDNRLCILFKGKNSRGYASQWIFQSHNGEHSDGVRRAFEGNLLWSTPIEIPVEIPEHTFSIGVFHELLELEVLPKGGAKKQANCPKLTGDSRDKEYLL
ncbi:MAG: hypothetical protein LKJ18_08960 [Ancrocorticia sp.]|jgi:hypothetical protein|nr:hypothetical protein [Ancrocorticia sp.]MCI2003031.1 hypothetical protein [Ancrocorticia sp.]